MLSNFWIADVKLFYLFFGLSRTAVNILYNYHRGNKEGVATYNKIMERVNQQEVIQAINNNDFDLAKKIFESIEDILVKINHNGDSTHSSPLHGKGMVAFKYLVINPPNTSDIINAWTHDSTNRGWDYFIGGTTFDDEKINADFKALKFGENKVHIQHTKEKNEPSGTKWIVLSMDTPSLKEYKAVYVSTETKTIDVDGVPSLYPVAFYNGKDLFEGCYVYSHDVKVVTAIDEFKTVVIK